MRYIFQNFKTPIFCMISKKLLKGLIDDIKSFILLVFLLIFNFIDFGR